MSRATAAALLCLLPLPALAGFVQKEQTVQLHYAQDAATVEFCTGDGSTITKAKPLCDCMTLRTEGSRLVAQVNTSTFDATVDKLIEVSTSDGQRSTLTIRFEVPLAVIISSPSLVWQRGAEPTAQEFRLRIPEGSPVRGLRAANLMGKDFLYRAATITPGREYAITVKPHSTARRCMNRLFVEMEGPDPRYTRRILFLQVK